MLPTTRGRYVAGEVQRPMNGVYDGDVFELAADWRKVVAFDGTPIFASIEYTTALTLSRAHLEAL